MKDNISYAVVGQQKSVKVKGVRADDTIELLGLRAQEKYLEPLRLVTFHDEEEDRVYHFLTNNFRLAASEVAGIYKARWELKPNLIQLDFL
jgi:hypothetical protein